MALLSVVFVVVSLGACMFVPAFLVAFVMLRSAARAAVLAATFSMGALTGWLVAWLIGKWAVTHRHADWITETLSAVFMTAGAAAGGVLAVYALGKLSRQPPWRRI